MKMEKCFAYKFDEQKQTWECSALQRTCDGCKIGCKFYKSEKQRLDEIKKEREEKPKNTIKTFTLIINGKQHGYFTSIYDIDIYLKKFYLWNKEEIDALFELMKARDNNLSDFDIDKVMYTHKVRFLYKEA